MTLKEPEEITVDEAMKGVEVAIATRQGIRGGLLEMNGLEPGGWFDVLRGKSESVATLLAGAFRAAAGGDVEAIRWREWQRWMHKLRAVKMRVRYWLGLPCHLLPAVPEHDRRSLLRLRLALEMMKREETPANPPETSGIHTRSWHPLDRIARRGRAVLLPSDAVAAAWAAQQEEDSCPNRSA